MTDAEVIAVAMDFFQALGLNNLELHINSIGCPNCREIHRKALIDFLSDRYDELCETCKGRFEKNPMRILDCKNENCQKLVAKAPRMIDYLDTDCREDFELVKESLESMKLDYIVDPDIVRGLDYYNKTAFEIVSKEIGAQSTVCGGGRYDHLFEELGGPQTTGVGFGLGIERLLLTLDGNHIDIEDENGTDVFVVALGENARQVAIGLLREMRQEDLKAQMDLMGRSAKAQFKYADKIKAKFTLVIGDTEIEEKTVQLKEMATFEQQEVKLDDIILELKKRLK